MTPEQNKTIHRAIQMFGAENQKRQAIEELMELQRAVFENIHRGTDNRDNITEEIADVEIMLAQLKKIYGISELNLEMIKDYKLNRLNTTIEKFQAKKVATHQSSVKIDRNTSNGRID